MNNTEDRSDKYTIVKEDDTSYIITITELWSIGHLTFKKPLEITVYFSQEPETKGLAYIGYDFGMDDQIQTIREKNCLYDYNNDNEEADPIKTVFATIKFDLMHAFFHYQGDPNYNHTHWALYGNLGDRVEASDDSIFEDYEKSVQADNNVDELNK